MLCLFWELPNTRFRIKDYSISLKVSNHLAQYVQSTKFHPQSPQQAKSLFNDSWESTEMQAPRIRSRAQKTSS